MQNKKTLKVLIAVIGLICLYELSFTLFTKRFESEAQENSDDATEYAQYVKEHATEELWLGLNYLECKKREINLGLDLRGGVSVTLEIAVDQMVRSLAGPNANSPQFRAVEKRALELKKLQPGGYLDLFEQAYSETPSTQNSLMAKYFVLDGITVQSTNEEVMAKLREAADGAIGQAKEVLRTRVKQFGVAQPDIKLVGNTGRIIVDLPGVKDIKRVRKLLQGSADLEIWDVYEVSSLAKNVNAIDKLAKAAEDLKKAKNDTAAVVYETEQDSLRAEFPFSFRVGAIGQAGRAILGYVALDDTAKVMEYLKLAKEKKVLPKSLVPAWSVEDESGDNAGVFQLYFLKSERDGGAFMRGEFITGARADVQDLQDVVLLDFKPNASKKWEEITGKSAAAQGKPIAIVLDGVVHSAPGASEKISGGGTRITSGGGKNSAIWAKDLANVLNAGKFPAPAKIVQELTVGPTLGEAAISAATWSFAIALLLVLAYMIYYYSTAGWVASLALLANMFLIVGVLAAFPTISLTLPGVAGIVLTIGMSVDANVLIYERIREELKLGKGMKLAIADGYKHAYTAILDANVTTLITGVILWYFGTSVIESFAQTLVAGIFTSLFSAIFITRLVFDSMLGKEKEIKFSTPSTEKFFANSAYNVISSRKKFYVASGLVIVLGVASMFSRGFDLGTDFSGGRSYIVQFEGAVDAQEVRDNLNGVFIDPETGSELPPEVKKADGDDKLIITTKFLASDESKEASAKVESFLFAGVKKFMPQGMEEEDFVDLAAEDKVAGVLQIDHVQSTIADDIIDASYKAVLIALIAIFAYVAFRFRQWQFGLGALIAIFHDVLVVMGIFSIAHGILPFSLEINSSFVAAVLTVVGYSINDTVVVFDRIRERLGLRKTESLPVVVNKALNSTLSRTFNTSITIVVVLLAIMIVGTGSLKGFAFALLVGVVVGTYSSLCIATPIYVDLVKKDKAE